ncbi:MAG: hypothetical protein ACJ0SL_01185 [Candidatus Rariloculaceae bacterium]
MRITIRMGLVFSLIISSSVVYAQADGGQPCISPEEITEEHESVRCISIRAIRELTAVDDQNLVFELRNGDYYLNKMSSLCDSAKRTNRFSFDAPSGRLCNADMINVVRLTSGAATSTVGCGLTRFYSISEAEAAMLGVRDADPSGPGVIKEEDPNAEADEYGE